ncbi:MAG: protealysin inhibitor emfourin [Ilumatobacteraceae bacterium]
MTILSARPLTVKLNRSGGFAGLRRTAEHTLDPGTAAHAAALEVLRNHRHRPAEPPPARPDGFAYDLAIASPGRTVLHRTFRDPLPDDVAHLLAALPAPT